MTLLLDTTILIEVLRDNKAVIKRLESLVEAGHLLATSSVNIAELYAGIRPNETAHAARLVSRLECYPVSCAIGHRAGLVTNALARQGRTHAIPDMLVAATALEHGLTVMTANRKDFIIPELQLLPSDPEPITRT